MPSPASGPAADTILTDHRVIACDGGGGALGHPRVWLRIEDRDIQCSYCSRHYVLTEAGLSDHGH